jgi:hypothetical protein
VRRPLCWSPRYILVLIVVRFNSRRLENRFRLFVLFLFLFSAKAEWFPAELSFGQQNVSTDARNVKTPTLQKV